MKSKSQVPCSTCWQAKLQTWGVHQLLEGPRDTKGSAGVEEASPEPSLHVAAVCVLELFSLKANEQTVMGLKQLLRLFPI